MKYRDYNPKRDKEAVHRIWREVGWLKKGKEEAMDLHVESGRAIVADVNNEAECLVATVPGTIRYVNEELPFFGITGVTTSRIARKQGLAKQLTAMMVAIEYKYLYMGNLWCLKNKFHLIRKNRVYLA